MIVEKYYNGGKIKRNNKEIKHLRTIQVNNVFKQYNIDRSLLHEKLEIFNKLLPVDETMYEKQCHIFQQLSMREHTRIV